MPGRLTSDFDDKEDCDLAKAIAAQCTGDLPKFPRRIYVKEYSMHGNGDWFWKSLCVVYDNEALGFLERILEIEHMSEAV